MPKLTVIVPVYNTEKYLKKCIDSLLSQTLDNIQIIIVNDGSTDNSAEIINEFYINYHDRIMVINKENGGLSSSRNFAFSHIAGEYVGFVDSDDYIQNNMYEEMYNLARQNDLDFVECDFYWDYPSKSKIDIGRPYINKQSYYIDSRVMSCNKIFRSDLILDNKIFFPEGLRYEDIEFFYKLIPYIKKSGIVNKPLYHYIQREISIVNNQNIKNADIFIILNNILEFYKNQNIYDNYKNELEYLYIRILLGSSFLRIIKIKNKKIRKELLNKTINELYNKFPDWQKNKILKSLNNKKNIYYKTINKFTYKIYCGLFRILRSII